MFVRTVRGDIDQAELGTTLSHEHLLGRPPAWMIDKDPDLDITNLENALMEARTFQAAGGRSVFEASAWDYERNPAGLLKISCDLDINIIACAGFNKGMWFDDMISDWSVERLTQHIVTEVTVGMNSTSIRGGCIKFGTGYNHISETEERVIRAAARAHRSTGAPLHGHTEIGTMAHEQIEILESEGVDLTRVGFVHVARNLDMWYLDRIAATGAYLVIDGISKVKYAPESARIGLIIELQDRGYSDQVLVGGDLARRTDLHSYTKGPGLRYILEHWLPRLRENLTEHTGSAEEASSRIDAIFMRNPARYFAFCDAY